MYIVIAGSFAHGFRVFGPFQRKDDAIDWAERQIEIPTNIIVEKVRDPNVWKPGSYVPPGQSMDTSS